MKGGEKRERREVGLYEAMEYKRRSKEMNDRGERRLRGRKLWGGGEDRGGGI